MSKNRNACIDSVKGLLILLVILGHILPGTLYENPARFVIYSFHLPAFFFVSGYLLNGKKLREDPLRTTAGRYAVRILVPWLAAVPVYYVLLHAQEPFSLTGWLMAYVRPYYHLWFCPGFLFCVAAACLALKLFQNKGVRVLLALGGLFAALYMAFTVREPGGELLAALRYAFRPRFLLFFALGMFSRGAPLSRAGSARLWIQGKWRLFLLLYVAFLFVGFHYQDHATEVLVRYVLLVLLFLGVDFETHTKGLPLLEEIGKETYPLYLWHVVGKEIGVACGHVYLCSLIWLALLALLLRVVKKDSKLRLVIGR